MHREMRPGSGMSLYHKDPLANSQRKPIHRLLWLLNVIYLINWLELFCSLESLGIWNAMTLNENSDGVWGRGNIQLNLFMKTRVHCEGIIDGFYALQLIFLMIIKLSVFFWAIPNIGVPKQASKFWCTTPNLNIYALMTLKKDKIWKGFQNIQARWFSLKWVCPY